MKVPPGYEAATSPDQMNRSERRRAQSRRVQAQGIKVLVNQDGKRTVVTREMQREYDAILAKYTITEAVMASHHHLSTRLVSHIFRTQIGGVEQPGRPDLDIRTMRRKVRKMFDTERAVIETQGVTDKIDFRDELAQTNAEFDRWLNATWFDIRDIAHAGSAEELKSYQEAAAFGRELVAEGICELPYKECVFVVRAVFDLRDVPGGRGPGNSDNVVGALLLLTAQKGREIKVEEPIGCFLGEEQSACMHLHYGQNGLDISKAFIEPILYSVAIMATKYVQATRCNLFANKANPNPSEKADQKLDYYVLELKPAVRETLTREHGGSHASPRLHWRRGHIRTYHRDQPNQFTSWIAMTLIGVAEDGIVVKDYAARKTAKGGTDHDHRPRAGEHSGTQGDAPAMPHAGDPVGAGGDRPGRGGDPRD